MESNTRPWADDGKRCRYCRWVEGYFPRFSCGNPKCLRGQAGVNVSCCSYEREPGSDDDLSEGPLKDYPQYR